MHSYLIFSAGVKFNLQKSVSATASKHLIARHGQLALFRILSRIHFIFRSLGKIAPHLAGILLDISLYHSYIFAVEHHIVPIVLKQILGFLILGKHHQPGSVTVETMHYKQFIKRILPFQIFAHYRICRAVLHLVVAHRQQSIAFFDNHDIVILIHKFHTTVGKHPELACQIDADLIVRPNRSVELADHIVIDSHLVVLKHLLDGSALALRHDFQHELQQLSLCSGSVVLYYIRFKVGAHRRTFTVLIVFKSRHSLIYLDFFTADLRAALFFGLASWLSTISLHCS